MAINNKIFTMLFCLMFILTSCVTTVVVKDLKYPATRIREIKGISIKVENVIDDSLEQKSKDFDNADKKELKDILFLSSNGIYKFAVRLGEGKDFAKQVESVLKSELNSLGYDTDSNHSDYILNVKILYGTIASNPLSIGSQDASWNFNLRFEYSLMNNKNKEIIPKTIVDAKRTEQHFIQNPSNKAYIENCTRISMNTLQKGIDDIVSGTHKKILDDVLKK